MEGEWELLGTDRMLPLFLPNEKMAYEVLLCYYAGVPLTCKLSNYIDSIRY